MNVLCSIHNSIFSPQRYKNFCIYANKWRKSRHFSLEDARKRAIRLEVRGGITAGIAARTEPNDGKLARRTTASAPHNASVIEDPAED